MDYTVKKVEAVQPAMPVPPNMPATFVVVYTKVVKDVDGNDVTIPDHEERVSLAQLEAQKAELQSRMDEITAKIEAIEALK